MGAKRHRNQKYKTDCKNKNTKIIVRTVTDEDFIETFRQAWFIFEFIFWLLYGDH